MWLLCDDKEAMIPGRVVAQVFGDAFVDERELGAPKAKVLDEPLSMRPGVQVLAVEQQLTMTEVELALRRRVERRRRAPLLLVAGRQSSRVLDNRRASARRHRRVAADTAADQQRRTNALGARVPMMPHLVVLWILGRQLEYEAVQLAHQIAPKRIETQPSKVPRRIVGRIHFNNVARQLNKNKYKTTVRL